MITLSKKHLVYLCLGCMVAGWWLTSSSSSPIGPAPQKDRPVLRFLAKAAKNLLWIALIAEQPPAESACMVQTRIGPDGELQLNHGSGW